MNLLHISDLHGRTCWKKPVKQFIAAQPDNQWTITFGGDYVDSFTYKGPEQLDNLTDVILLKRQYPDNVVLLLGNHDFQYALFNHNSPSSYYRCSGFQPLMAPAFYALFHDHKDYFQIAYEVAAEHTTYLFVHAGVQLDWLQHNQVLFDTTATLIQATRISDVLNALLLTKRGQDALYEVSRVNGGYHAFDGPLWVRPGQLSKSVLPGYTQVVGHTPLTKGIVRAIHTEESGEHTGQQTGVILTDCLHDGAKSDQNEFLTLEL